MNQNIKGEISLGGLKSNSGIFFKIVAIKEIIHDLSTTSTFTFLAYVISDLSLKKMYTCVHIDL